MLENLKPIKSESLTDIFIRRFEELIISGKISIGQKLPSERDLAFQLGVSRPVVHEGLIELEVKGLVSMKPRSGCVVNDYRRSGSLPLLKSLIEFSRGRPGPEILEGLLRMRILFETETASLAAEHRTTANIEEMNIHIKEEEAADRLDTEKIVSLDFGFHLLTAISSGNMIYPLMLNSFKDVYTNLTRVFFKDRDVVDFVFSRHAAFAAAMNKKDKKLCLKIMKSIMEHGEQHLKNLLSAGK